jgi:hypothetical protein
MKKVLLVSVLFLVSTLTFSQCYNSKRNYDRESHFGLVANIGTLKSLGGEIYVKFNNHIIGGGYAREINGAKVENEEFKNETLYLTYGYQYERYTFGVRYGKQNKANWIDKTPNDNYNIFEKEVTPYSTMLGGYVGYNLSNKVAINLGYDTFSQVTIGIVMGL